MYTVYLPQLLKMLLGPGGRYYASHGTLADIMRCYVLGAFYRYVGYMPADRTMVGIYSGNTKPSHMLTAYYGNSVGYDALCDDLYALMRGGTSIVGMRCVQDQIHEWASDLGINTAAVERCYVAHNAEISDIAAYTAGVMQYILTS